MLATQFGPRYILGVENGLTTIVSNVRYESTWFGNGWLNAAGTYDSIDADTGVSMACVAVCCSVLQCVAVVSQSCCSHVAVCCRHTCTKPSYMQIMLFLWRVLQLVAVVLQCVAVCCCCVAVLWQLRCRCVAVVLQCFADIPELNLSRCRFWSCYVIHTHINESWSMPCPYAL